MACALSTRSSTLSTHRWLHRPCVAHMRVACTHPTVLHAWKHDVAPATDTALRHFSLLPVALMASLLLSQPVAAQDSWTGQARVVDGDTMVIGEQRFRLYAVDAPEKTQTCVNAVGAPYACGLVSKDALTQKVGNQTVTCKAKAKDLYGRTVAICSLDTLFGSEDLNQWLVANGLAVAYREYGKDYIPDEDKAHAARQGIWAGTFEYPAKWRKEEKAKVPHPPFTPIAPYTPPPLPPSTAPSSPSSTPRTVMPAPVSDAAATVALAASQVPEVCGKGVLPIKGNISSKGARIYHLPGSPIYDKVLIEENKGEAFFCSEEDASKAGFRPARTGAAGQ